MTDAETQALENLLAAKEERRSNPTPETIAVHQVAIDKIQVVRSAERRSANVFPTTVAATMSTSERK